MASQANIIWKNLRHYKGKVPIQKKSSEMLGLVVQHGVNNKTCTVLVRWRTWFNRAGCFVGCTSRYQVHDEEEFACAGDIVVIKQCAKIAAKKNYYVRNIVRSSGRLEYWDNLDKQGRNEIHDAADEKYQEMKQEYTRIADKRKTKMKKRHEDLQKLKMRAMHKAYTELKEGL